MVSRKSIGDHLVMKESLGDPLLSKKILGDNYSGMNKGLSWSRKKWTIIQGWGAGKFFSGSGSWLF